MSNVLELWGLERLHNKRAERVMESHSMHCSKFIKRSCANLGRNCGLILKCQHLQPKYTQRRNTEPKLHSLSCHAKKLGMALDAGAK